VEATDAEFLEKEFAPEFNNNDLVNLGFGQIYIKLMIDGFTSRPFLVNTLSPVKRPPKSHFNKIIRVSRERYNRAREKVEEKL